MMWQPWIFSRDELRYIYMVYVIFRIIYLKDMFGVWFTRRFLRHLFVDGGSSRAWPWTPQNTKVKKQTASVLTAWTRAMKRRSNDRDFSPLIALFMQSETGGMLSVTCSHITSLPSCDSTRKKEKHTQEIRERGGTVKQIQLDEILVNQHSGSVLQLFSSLSLLIFCFLFLSSLR